MFARYLGSPDTDTACVDDLPRSIRRDIAVHNVRDVIERCGVFKETSEVLWS